MAMGWVGLTAHAASSLSALDGTATGDNHYGDVDGAVGVAAATRGQQRI
jgi:hypothetical protein